MHAARLGRIDARGGGMGTELRIRAIGRSETLTGWRTSMSLKRSLISLGAALAALASTTALTPSSAMAQDQKQPNILFVMTDDVGWMTPGIYHQGMMVGETPNIDRIGREGVKFIDAYSEQSCTAGRNPS
jgi:hypothetical protein